MADAEFAFATEHVKSFAAMGNDDKLALYGFFKQQAAGDCNTSRPGVFDPVGRAKYDAWKGNRGMGAAEAREAYKRIVDRLDPHWCAAFQATLPPAEPSVHAVSPPRAPKSTPAPAPAPAPTQDVRGASPEVPDAIVEEVQSFPATPAATPPPAAPPTPSPSPPKLAPGRGKRPPAVQALRVETEAASEDDEKKAEPLQPPTHGLRTRRHPLQRLWAAYVEALEARPLATKALTAGTLNALEEYSAQRITRRPLDLARVAKMAAYGLCVNGPLGHVLYGAVGRALGGLKGALGSVAQLLAVNLGVLPLQTAVYLAAMAKIGGESNEGARRAVAAAFWPLMKTTWQAFPLIQVLTFKLLPPALWTPFFNALGFVFGVYSNVLANRPGAASSASS